jgi:hypothetical protein
MIGAGLIGQQWPAVHHNDDRCRPDRPATASRSSQRSSVQAWRACGPSQPWPALDQLHFTAPTERTPSRGSASNGQPVGAMMIGAAVAGPKSTPVSRRRRSGRPPGPRPMMAIRSSQRSSVRAWRAAVPRSRGRPWINSIPRHRRSGRPPGARPAMASRSSQR